MEIYRVLALSTGHVSQETAQLMGQGAISKVIIYNKGDFGWFVHIPDKGMDFKELEDSECPADLYRCMKYARDNNCDWLMFDRDVEANEDLPVYNW